MSPSDELRRLVWEAAASGDARVFESVCRVHQDEILQHFSAWRQLPPELRDRPADCEAYIATLIRVAQLFDEQLKRPELMRLLQGDDNNPLARWQKKLEEARAGLEEFRIAETVSMLTALI